MLPEMKFETIRCKTLARLFFVRFVRIFIKRVIGLRFYNALTSFPYCCPRERVPGLVSVLVRLLFLPELVRDIFCVGHYPTRFGRNHILPNRFL